MHEPCFLLQTFQVIRQKATTKPSMAMNEKTVAIGCIYSLVISYKYVHRIHSYEFIKEKRKKKKRTSERKERQRKEIK